MHARRSLRAFLLIAMVTFVGCRPKANPQETNRDAGSAPRIERVTQQTPPASTAPQSQPAEAEPTHGTAAALARKTSSYAANVEPLLSRRAVKSDPPSPEWEADANPRPRAAVPQTRPSESRIDEPTKVAPAESRTTRISPAATTQPARGSKAVPETEIASAASDIQPNVGMTLREIKKPADRPHEDESAVPAAPAVAGFPKVSQRIKDYPTDVAAHLDYQLMKFLQDEPVPQLPALTPLPTEDREMLTALLDGLSNFRNTLRADNNMLLSRKIRPILEMADRLRTQGELSIPTLVICSGTEGYGKYEPIEPARFKAMRPFEIILYCEVENFVSEENKDHIYETNLRAQITLYQESDGLAVWTDTPKTVRDTCRNRRHDFCIPPKVHLPGNLPVGRYLLKMTIEDQKAKHVAENMVPLQLVAQ